MTLIRFALCALALGCLSPAWAINKCTDANGKVSFQDAPCVGEGEKIDVRPTTRGATPVPPAAAPVAGGSKVTAPMPGTILGVNVKEGEAVKAGQALFVLEAMKMESDVVAPVDGTVRGISVSKGASVSAGDLLCSVL